MNSYKSFIQHFRLSVAMATYQNEEFVQHFMHIFLYIFMASEELIIFHKFSISVAMATNEIVGFEQKLYIWWRTTQ